MICKNKLYVKSMESFSMLPVRTTSGKPVKEKQYQDLLDNGVSPGDAMDIVLGKKKHKWSDRMTYMSPSIYIGPSIKNEGIMKQLREPGIKNKKIRTRTIYLTGNYKVKHIHNNQEIKINDPIEFLKNQDSFDIIKGELDTYFELDEINDELDRIDFVPEEK